jgi:DNA adenine methylase
MTTLLEIQSPFRPMLRYHGGKWKLAPWIISHFPPHRIYTEAFGGAASVLARKQRSYCEVYNDVDGEIVNVFRVARDRGEELCRAVELTAFSRVEYRLSFEISDDALEQARRTVVRSYMGFGSNALCRPVQSGFRACSSRNGTTPSRDWKNFPAALTSLILRMQGVVIEHRSAEQVMVSHDGPETLHYCDPPYVHSTRTNWAGKGARSGYAHEMDDEAHRSLAAVLRGLRGKVIVSGYHSPLYDEMFEGWARVERKALADGARKRTEVLWMNYRLSPEQLCSSDQSAIRNPQSAIE